MCPENPVHRLKHTKCVLCSTGHVCPHCSGSTMPYDYYSFSRHAGPADPAPEGDYRVRLKRLAHHRPVRSLLIAGFAFTCEATFFGWLLTSADLSGGLAAPTTIMIVAI